MGSYPVTGISPDTSERQLSSLKLPELTLLLSLWCRVDPFGDRHSLNLCFLLLVLL